MDMHSMLAQAQKAQKELQKKLAEFEAKEFEYNYKNNSIVVNINGKGLITNIVISNVLVDKDDIQTLQEMIAEAINSAISGVQQDRKDIENAVTLNR